MYICVYFIVQYACGSSLVAQGLMRYTVEVLGSYPSFSLLILSTAESLFINLKILMVKGPSPPMEKIPLLTRAKLHHIIHNTYMYHCTSYSCPF